MVIIHDGCYAKALSVSGGLSTASSISMAYMAFTNDAVFYNKSISAPGSGKAVPIFFVFNFQIEMIAQEKKGHMDFSVVRNT